MEDYRSHHHHNHHHHIGPHTNISMLSTENSSWVGAYQTPRMPSIAESYRTDLVNVGSRIHIIEKEAYTGVLRAFIAQSDVLSWGKEGLITELRRELNITDQEHAKLLTEISSDEFVRMIRDYGRGNSHNQGLSSSRMDAPGFTPSPVTSVGNAPHRILKTSHADVSNLQTYVSRSQELPSRKMDAPGFAPSPGISVGEVPHKILKTSLAGVSTLPRYASHQPTSAANAPPLPVQCRGDQGAGELPTYSIGNGGQSMKVVIPNGKNLSASKCVGPEKPQTKTGSNDADICNLQKKSDIIEIHATDKLMHKVESMIYGREKPDLIQFEKAKSMLTEHEGTILDALAKLADVSDGDTSPKQFQHHHSQEELWRVRRGMTMHGDFYGQVDSRLRLH